MALTHAHDSPTADLLAPPSTNVYFANLGGSTGSFQQPAPSAPPWPNYSPSLDPPSVPYPPVTPQQFSAIPPSRRDVWDPVGVTGLPAGNNMSLSQQHPAKRQRTVRDGETLSDIGAHMHHYLFSDSGYATRSVGTRSVAGPYLMENKFQTTQPLDDVASPSSYSQPDTYLPIVRPFPPSPYPPTIPTVAPSPAPPVAQGLPGDRKPPRPKRRPPKSVHCDLPDCNWTGKTQCDLNQFPTRRKHMDRHEKRFKCDIADCRRREGFATPNDLDRHRKSVHGILPKHGSVKVFKCFVRGCSKRDKIWPRPDNFRQHLTRVHKGCNVKEMVRLSDEWFESGKDLILAEYLKNPDEGSTLTSQGDIDSQSHINGADLARDGNLSSAGYQFTQTASIHSGSLLHQSFRHTAPTSGPHSIHAPELSEGPQPDDRQAHGFLEQSAASKDGQISLEYSVAHDNSGTGAQFHSHSDQPGSPSTEVLAESAAGIFKALDNEMKKAQLRTRQTMQNSNGNQNKDTSQTPSFLDVLAASGEKEREFFYMQLASKNMSFEATVPEPPSLTQTSESRSTDNRTIKCPDCPTIVRRLCDLRKRHTRPYGCTFTDCDKRFGSKSDWKRHENSKHFQLESWRCHEPEIEQAFKNTGSLDTRECARQFFRSEQFANHLRKDHELGESRIRTCLRINKIGRNGQGQFWCGFCRKLVQLKSEGLDAFQDRFNHIDAEHFKKGQNIEDWLPPSGHLTKGEQKLKDSSSIMDRTSESSSDISLAIDEANTNVDERTVAIPENESRAPAPPAPRPRLQNAAQVSASTVRPSRVSSQASGFAPHQGFGVRVPGAGGFHGQMYPTASFQPISSQARSSTQSSRSAQRQIIADSLMSFAPPVQQFDPREDHEQCVTCVSFSFHTDDRCTLLFSRADMLFARESSATAGSRVHIHWRLKAIVPCACILLVHSASSAN
ncbi:predicted protein [Uncinocarpus reesii 1704]|uniref:C2H2-type domain-containing protein n=1 Tax=Uncinocarpus reesii (strain UAMH 1704) TaxID=336963 RepID=C4JIG2_UNCRE|nr:uncharacterized protein UREG_01499 [Uncinocarpus reesii 1704]EEP76650.1 predicted protein [Uncinocarpus reesii 1704]